MEGTSAFICYLVFMLVGAVFGLTHAFDLNLHFRYDLKMIASKIDDLIKEMD